MNPGSGLFLALAAGLAAGDWVAVSRGSKRAEYVCKPGTMLALIAAALLLDEATSPRRTWFVVALVASLAGDVLLMLPRDRFVAGLGAFLGAHLAYIGGLLQEDVAWGAAALGALVLGASVGPLGARIVAGARARDPRLALPVATYIVVIASMAALAVAVGQPLAAAGALSFVASDALIGWTRFVTPLTRAPVAIMVTYHLAQALLVLSLV